MSKAPNYLDFTGVLSDDTIVSVGEMKDERKGIGGVEELNQNPGNIGNPPGLSRTSMRITTTKNQDITDITIRFRLRKTNVDDPEDVTLYRYQNGWNELSTTYVRQTNNHYVFEASTPGLSYFIASEPEDTTGPGPITGGSGPMDKKIYPAYQNGKAQRNLRTVREGNWVGVELRQLKPEHAVERIQFKATEYIGSIYVKVQELMGKPEGTPGLRNTYKYLNITTQNAEPEQMENATVSFRVQKSWIEENSLPPEYIRLKKYVPEDDEWVTLNTTMIGETENHTRFRAETPGFSYFAVTTELPEIKVGTLVDHGIYQEILETTARDRRMVLGKSAAPEVDASFTKDTMNFQGETYESEWQQEDYAVIQFKGDSIQILGTHRYGTQAASMYYREEKPTTTTLLKWIDTNGDNEVQYDEIEVIE